MCDSFFSEFFFSIKLITDHIVKHCIIPMLLSHELFDLCISLDTHLPFTEFCKSTHAKAKTMKVPIKTIFYLHFQLFYEAYDDNSSFITKHAKFLFVRFNRRVRSMFFQSNSLVFDRCCLQQMIS